jgi:hypothetical protein
MVVTSPRGRRTRAVPCGDGGIGGRTVFGVAIKKFLTLKTEVSTI